MLYPKLASHKHHELAKKQFPNGAGGVIAFELKSGDSDAPARFVDAIIEKT